jgi:uncharacterized protein with HEPN domain
MRKSRQYVAGASFEECAEDDETVYAVIRALEGVGEAAIQIPA